jgi:hypothetical protein
MAVLAQAAFMARACCFLHFCIFPTLSDVRECCGLSDRIGASGCRFNALHDEMLAEELRVFFARVEVMWCQYSGQDRCAGFQLHLHQAGDDSLRHEFMPVDAAVDHEACGNNSRIAATLSEQLRVQRDFKGTGDFVEIDVVAAELLYLDGIEEGCFALVDNVAMPARLNECDTRTRLRCRANGGITFESSGERHKYKPVCVNRAKDGTAPNANAFAQEDTRRPVLFHPDYDRRPRDQTGSADLRVSPCLQGKFKAKHKALAGYAQKLYAITAGGEFHPAPRTRS